MSAASSSAAVVDEGGRLAALVDKLLDLSKLQAGRAEPRRDWISLEDVLATACEGLSDHGRIRLTIEPDIPDLRADGAQLERASRICSRTPGATRVQLPVFVHARRSGERVVVLVVDQGPGIAPAEQARIFEPFYRGRRSTGDSWTGSGLGLAIAKGFVEANGGTIAVESLPGQGTSFVVSLPIEEQARQR